MPDPWYRGRIVLIGDALLADYTTQPAEWRNYRRLWLKR